MKNLKEYNWVYIFGKFWWVVLLILTLPTVTSLLVPGYYGASDDLHVAWLFEMDKILSSGQIPPRFVPDLSYQFGYPLFNFVFPLPFYIGEVFHALGMNFVDSVKAVFLVSVPLSALSMYFLLKQYASKSLSLAGAVIYSYATYRAVDIYIRGAIGELFSFVFFPLVMLSVIHAMSSRNLRWVGVGGLSLAGLVLTHNIATYMFMPYVVFFVILNLIFKKIVLKDLSGVVMLVAFGLSISLYFWLPALVDSSLMKYNTVFNFVDHFPTIKQLFLPFWGYGASVPGPYDGLSFNIGTVNLLVALGGVIYGIVTWKKLKTELKVLLVWLTLSFLITIFMMNFRSAFLWANLPLLPYFQFPWRFLMMTTFITPLFIVFLEKNKYQTILAVLILGFAVGLNFNIFRPQDFLRRDDQYYLNKYIPNLGVSLEYSQSQEEYLRLPKNTEVRPDRLYPVLSGEGVGVEEVRHVNSLDLEARVDAQQEGVLSYNKYLFPGWEATVDGKATDINAGKPFGQMSILVPSGVHTVKFQFRETPLKLILDLVSAGGFLLSLVLIWMPKKLIKG